MKLKVLIPIGLVVLLCGAAVASTTLTSHGTTLVPRVLDCPGTLICPLTDQRICADRCPLDGAAADECPGTIVCPLDGEAICKDRCPLVADEVQVTEAPTDAALPACCAAVPRRE